MVRIDTGKNIYQRVVCDELCVMEYSHVYQEGCGRAYNLSII